MSSSVVTSVHTRHSLSKWLSWHMLADATSSYPQMKLWYSLEKYSKEHRLRIDRWRHQSWGQWAAELSREWDVDSLTTCISWKEDNLIGDDADFSIEGSRDNAYGSTVECCADCFAQAHLAHTVVTGRLQSVFETADEWRMSHNTSFIDTTRSFTPWYQVVNERQDNSVCENSVNSICSVRPSCSGNGVKTTLSLCQRNQKLKRLQRSSAHHFRRQHRPISRDLWLQTARRR